MDGAAPDVPTHEALRDRIEVEIQSGWQLHVALRDGRVVGMLAVMPALATLDQIFVAPRDQGTGVGKALLDLAKQLMPTGFTLRLAAANGRAGSFYEKEGLKPIGEGIHPRTGIPVRFYGWNVSGRQIVLHP
jgi:GNAT superfamily N-acetyltransferase